MLTLPSANPNTSQKFLGKKNSERGQKNIWKKNSQTFHKLENRQDFPDPGRNSLTISCYEK